MSMTREEIFCRDMDDNTRRIEEFREEYEGVLDPPDYQYHMDRLLGIRSMITFH